MLSSYAIDTFYRLYLLQGAVYYAYDILHKLYFINWPDDLIDPCFVGFTLHHIGTVLCFKLLWLVDYFPSSMIALPAYHAVMVIFAHFWLNNYIYFGLVLVWLYRLFTPPFSRRRVYVALGLISVAMLAPLAILGYYGCMQQ